MNKRILNILFLFLLTSMLFSCKDDGDYGVFNRDNRPEVPVTYVGATTHGFNPYFVVDSSSTAEIAITLQVPEGRTIKEITRVVGGNTAINAASVTTNATAANTITSNIPGEGNKATFVTSIPALKAKYTSAALTTILNGGTPFSEFAFMFLVTLDNDEQIIPVQCRLRIVKK